MGSIFACVKPMLFNLHAHFAVRVSEWTWNYEIICSFRIANASRLA